MTIDLRNLIDHNKIANQLSYDLTKDKDVVYMDLSNLMADEFSVCQNILFYISCFITRKNIDKQEFEFNPDLLENALVKYSKQSVEVDPSSHNTISDGKSLSIDYNAKITYLFEIVNFIYDNKKFASEFDSFKEIVNETVVANLPI